jgi:hypothetical protein
MINTLRNVLDGRGFVVRRDAEGSLYIDSPPVELNGLRVVLVLIDENSPPDPDQAPQRELQVVRFVKPSVEQVEDALETSVNDWDCVNPADLIDAVFRLSIVSQPAL